MEMKNTTKTNNSPVNGRHDIRIFQKDFQPESQDDQAENSKTNESVQEESKDEVKLPMSNLDQEFSKLQSRQKYSEYYHFQKLLGQGAFCSVYQAIDKLTGETIAVKVIRRKNLNSNDVNLLRQEAEILQTLDHQNIVQFKHIREIGGRIFLGMELLRGGQLTELIKQKKSQNMKFTDEEASSIMRCILQAVAYIHSIGIVHRDLKPDNILIGDVNDLSTIKLGDFGLSAKYEHSSFITLDQHCGTLIFMAPEVALKKEYSRSVDIWSLGIIMYMLLTGGSHPLFSSKDTAETYKAKLKNIKQLSFPSHLSVLAKNFYIRLTKFNIAQRYAASDALQHPWITRINKTLIPLTLPDKMNHFELESKLKHKISLMFFASIIKKAAIRNSGIKENNFTDPDMLNYKRLLNKVTKKIDKWHEEKSKLKEQFEKDEEYIEHEQSPTNFDSSSDESESIDSAKKQSPSRDNQKRSKQGSINVQTQMQIPNFQRKKSLKKTSVTGSPPVRKDQQQLILDKKKRSPMKVASSTAEGLNGVPLSGVSTQSSNQNPMSQLQASKTEDKQEKNLQIANQSSFGSYYDQTQAAYQSFKNTNQIFQQSVKNANTKGEPTMEEQLRQSFINSDRVLQIQNQVDPYPQNSSTYIATQSGQSQIAKKNLNISQISGAGDISVFEAAHNEQNNANFLQQKRGLKSFRDQDGNPTNIKKVGSKKQNHNIQQQSYPQQTTTHQINLNDILKKNEGYDQKFLFKKNFIPKQKPVMIANHMLTQQQYYPNGHHHNSSHGSTQSNFHNQMQNTGYPFQMNFKAKRPKKSGNKSHSQGGANQQSANKQKLNQSNMPLNYFTLNIEQEENIPREMHSVAHKYWNSNQNDPTSQQQFGHKGSSSDLPLIVNKVQNKQADSQNSSNLQIPLQKSKTKNYDSKFKNSGISVNGSANLFNGFMSSNNSAIKEEDGYIGQQNRPITSGSGKQGQGSLAQGQNRNNLNMIEQQQLYTFDQMRSQYETEHLNNIISSQFATPNMSKGKANGKIKGLDLGNPMSQMECHTTKKKTNNYQLGDEFVSQSIMKDLAGANKSFDMELINYQQLQQNQQQFESGVKSQYSHKRHKSMSNKLKQSQINYHNQNNSNHPMIDPDYKQLGNFKVPHTNPRGSIASKGESGMPMQHLIITQMDSNQSHSNPNTNNNTTTNTHANNSNNNSFSMNNQSMLSTQYHHHHHHNGGHVSHHNSRHMNSVGGTGGGTMQQKPGTGMPNGIQGQQVILTDNYVNGFTNQIIKYKNKIIIRQP